jgi:hypothetical protein
MKLNELENIKLLSDITNVPIQKNNDNIFKNKQKFTILASYVAGL